MEYNCLFVNIKKGMILQNRSVFDYSIYVISAYDFFVN